MPASSACISCELSALMCSRISASLALRSDISSPSKFHGDDFDDAPLGVDRPEQCWKEDGWVIWTHGNGYAAILTFLYLQSPISYTTGCDKLVDSISHQFRRAGMRNQTTARVDKRPLKRENINDKAIAGFFAWRRGSCARSEFRVLTGQIGIGRGYQDWSSGAVHWTMGEERQRVLRGDGNRPGY